MQDYLLKNTDKKILIFTETKAEAQQFAACTYANFLTLHEDVEQTKRQSILEQFKQSGPSILVTTDVAASGINIDDIDLVVQFSVKQVDHFVSRAGHVAKDGTNLILSSKHDLLLMKECEEELKMNVKYTNSFVSNG